MNDEIFKRLFDPRMPVIMSLMVDTLQQVRNDPCQCDVCMQLRAIQGTLDAIREEHDRDDDVT